uniref:F-box domain-containing protein n=1 Tax=Oryza nivara TaxID=4536 RepID=A0A0E0GK61_ORYNI
MRDYQRFARAVAAVAAAAGRHLPDDAVISDISRSLSSRAAHRLAAACPRWRAILSQPTFLCRHLSPRPLAGERPRALIVQPRKLGFTHLSLVAVDPADELAVHVPIRNKYKRPTRLYHESHRRSFIPNASAADEPLPEPEPDRFADHLAPGLEVVDADDDDDHVAFFERTVPALDISIVAAHGRLLLARGRSCYYVCDPAANRWVELPPSTLPPEHGINSGLHYDDLDDDASSGTGRLDFTVVLIGCRHRRVVVETFTSATGRWETKELPEQGTQGLARSVGGGPASPGIHVGGCFYWLTHRRNRGRILRYDVAGGRVTVVREPARAEGSIGRAERSLGSTGGRLRMCAFDVRDDSDESGSPYPHDGGVGVHGVWVMTTDDGVAAPAWRRVHEATVDDVGFYYFHMLFERERPVDFAGACGDFVVLDDSGYKLWRYDYLESGDNRRVELWNLNNPKDDNLRDLYERNQVSFVFEELYDRYHVFPFFG